MNFAGLLLSLLLSSSLIPHFSAQPNSDDIAAMQALSRSLSGDKSLGWSPSTSPCNWRFVTCSGDRVSSIQIGNQSLSGRIPPDIAKLTSLTRLELHSNRISGDLNPISSLTSLQTLLLHNNLFSYIPASFFSNLTSLRAVYLDDNPFQIWEIPESLRSAVNLVNFSANSANVSGEIPDFVATGFPSLNHLALAFNLLSGNIPPTFAGSPIRSLWLNNQHGGAALSGGIGFIQNMTDLEQIWLNSNSFSGPLPDFSALINLRDLRLRDNYFTGPIPSSLTSLKSLTKLSLTNNLLQGSFPKFPNSINELDLDPKTERFCLLNQGVSCDSRVDTLLSISSSFHYPIQFAENWKGNNPCDGSWIGISCDNKGNIIVINFQKMGLNGTISPEFAKLVDLQLLLLSNNNLTGEIPSSLTRLTSLKELDVSYNSLVGKLPIFANNVVLKTQGNPNIGQDLPPPSSTSGDDPGIAGKLKVSSNPSLGVILGSVLAAVCTVSLLVFTGTCYYKRRKQQFHRVQSPNSDSSPDNIKITVAAPNSNCNNEIQVAEAGNMAISIQVLRNVTNNFSEENIIGRGGFGTVYRGDLHDGTKIAVKRMECGGAVGSKGLNEFESEIAVLTKVRHRNLVSLLGYCLDGGERLLVYEYMPQGSLSRHLFEWKEEGLRPLEWKKRLSIALDVARGVEYLHTLAHQSFIHRDLKPSNILLGDDMKAKVADFGLVRLADGKGCAAVTKLAGTFGYLAPEYAAIGRVTTKADVFSFGVILMEMITGRKALDETQPEESVHLVTWFRRMQIANRDGGFLKSVVDPSAVDVGDEEALAGIAAVVGLAGHCCNREPGQRPDMGHAVNVLSTLTELWKPSDLDTEESCGIDLDMSLPQALKRWQAFEDRGGGEMSSFLGGIDSTSIIIPTRPPGFAETFTSGDGR